MKKYQLIPIINDINNGVVVFKIYVVLLIYTKIKSLK